MRRLVIVLLCLVLLPMAVAAQPQQPLEVANGAVRATIGPDEITFGNQLVQRTWTRAPYGTVRIVDRRSGLVTGVSPDFRLRLADGVEVTGADFSVSGATAEPLPRGGLRLTMTLTAPVGTVTRVVTMFNGVAGFEVRTSLSMAGALTGYVLDELNLPDAAPTLHAFAAGYDWRGTDTPDWEPTFAPFGGANTGDHRVTRTAAAGQSLEGEGEWLSLATAEGGLFQVLERVNYASSRGAYDGARGGAAVDLSQDAIYLGPLEGDVHVANPRRLPVRQRLLRPDRPLDLEPVFTGLAVDADDEPWQYTKYVQRFRAPRWNRGAITFNSNGVDSNRISTGAKDDMDLAEVVRQAAIARRLGVDTFILDDGWQAISGDWCPDSPDCPEPRHGTSPKFAPRFPDAEFAAVREAIGDMTLGLWMSPMHFNPSSEAMRRNPNWICPPVGTGTTLLNLAQPESGSGEAGIGTWNPEGLGIDGRLIDYVESRIRRAIEQWGVRYFKFDFLVWLDCAGVDPVTAYDYRESFLRMLDRLIADHPTVTFQIDETNDYRLFPFESVTRGPSWYANGSPKAHEALHNLWVLAPFVPGSTIGQATLGGDRGRLPADYLMAVALGSHLTYFTDLTRLSEQEIRVAGEWAERYRRHRDRFTAMAYPLLEDPVGGGNWTALQPWDRDEQSGALLVYRQDAPESMRTVALRGIDGSGRYRLTDVVTDQVVGEYDADELRAGIPITLPQRHSAAVLLVDRV